MSATDHYDTDLTDEQWELLEPWLLGRKWQPGGPGRPPIDVRQVLNGILYLNKTGCQWRLIPKAKGLLENPCLLCWSSIPSQFCASASSRVPTAQATPRDRHHWGAHTQFFRQDVPSADS